jgi:Xaa-Pro aminopeptidase
MGDQEYLIKAERLRTLMQQRTVDAVWLTQNVNMAWLTGGKRTSIDTSSERGIASLLVTADQRYVITTNIEAERLRDEETFDGWEIVAEPWYASGTALNTLMGGLRVATDHQATEMLDVSKELIKLRAPLTPPEITRYRTLGHDIGAAIARVAHQIKPGMSEHEVAGLLAQATYAVAAIPIVILVASDERLQKFRHPLPTGKLLERVVMLVLCAQRHGLVANLTRIVHWGPVPSDLRRRSEAVARIEATAIAATQPGASIADVLDKIQQAYAAVGFEGEWRNHHQGGACSYASRDYFATPHSEESVRAPQAFAWNPSLPGAKSEDTVLICDAGAEVLTISPGWPTLTFDIHGQHIERLNILEL